MKKRTARVAALLLALLLCALSLASCAGGDYITREEWERFQSQMGNVTVEGGDSYHVTVTGDGTSSLLAASHALLSSVSVRSNFTVGSSGYATPMYGAGVIYRLDKERGDAYIITNYHVVYYSRATTVNRISDDIDVFLYGQESDQYAIPATYIGGSMLYDIAVLKVTGSRVLAESNAAVATLANSDEVAVLETAIAIGNPEAEGISVTVGHVNVDSEYIKMYASDNTTLISLRVMRIDAAVNSGNSGGGLFNERGELIGVVNAKLSDDTVDNIGYAIPSNIASYVADNIIYYCDGTDKECVYRCILGITVNAKASGSRYDTETGRVHKYEVVEISEVTEGSLADGVLTVGDEISALTIDGVRYPVTRMYHVVDAMLNARVGSTVVFDIVRDGRAEQITVEIPEKVLTAYK